MWLRRSVNPKPCWCQIASAFHMAELEAVSKQIREQYLSKYTKIAKVFIIFIRTCSS